MKRLTTTMVRPIGPLDAKVCFVGEAPGEEEDKFGEPFVGAAGRLFKRILSKHRFVWSECLVANIFAQRPPKNKVEYFYEDKGPRQRTKLTWEGMEHVERLRVWLEKLRLRRDQGKGGPNVLVALGRTAMFHLTGKKRVYKWRGSVLPCTLVPGFKVYVTIHPSNVLRLMNEEGGAKLQGEKKKQSQNALPLFEIDMDRIKQQWDSPILERPERKFEVNLSHGELVSRLEWILQEKPKWLACDIETLQGTHGPIVWCVGFSPSPEWAFCVPFIRKGNFAWALEEEAKLWILISKIFLEKEIQKIFQFGNYDLSVLGRYYGLRLAKGTWEDTMYCHHASYPYLWKGLEVLASIYTWEPYYKDEGRINIGSRTDETEFNYNCKDCAVTREILPIEHSNARELQTFDGYRRTMSILPSHIGMSIRGVRIDIKKKEKLSRDFSAKAGELHQKVCAIAKQDINLNSHTQKAGLLYGYLGLELQFQRGKKGKVTTDKNALNKLKRKYAGTEKGQIVEWILDYQKFSKLASTYAEMKLDSDGRVRTSYSVVSTWRTNSSSSPFGGETKEEREGGNLQNIPVREEEGRMIRELFIPDPGMVLLSRDMKQAEAMFVAWDSQDMERIHLFLNGFDIHWYNAKQIFGIPDSVAYNSKAKWKSPLTGEWYTLKEFRDIGKTISHASNYGMGPYKLQEVLALRGFILEFRHCRAFLEEAKTKNFYLLAWQRELRDLVRTSRMLLTPPPLNRKREFLGRFGPALWNTIYAFRPQSSVGEVNEITIQRIWEKIPICELLLNVHDDAVVQCKEKDLREVIERIEEVSHFPLQIRGRELDIPVDFKWSPHSWGEMEKIKL